jgi:hypothetical protein
MKDEDLLALAALAGGAYAFKNKADKDYAELPEQKELAARRAKAHKKGGKVSSASSRADGCAIRGKTKGRMV